MEFLLKSKQIKVLIFIVLCFFIYIYVAKSDIIQTIHLLTLNNLLGVKVKNARNGLNRHFHTSILLFFPGFGAKLL